MEVPDGFAVVEAGLFRARSAPDYVFPFLKTLNLKTIIVMDPGTPSRSFSDFAAANNIELIHLVVESWRPINDAQQQKLTCSMISKSLEYILDKRNYPLMVFGTNLVTGVIRKLENWSLSAVLNEYNAYSETSAHSNPFGSVFLEFLEFVYTKEDDSLNDDSSTAMLPYLIHVKLPEVSFRPDWVRRFDIN